MRKLAIVVPTYNRAASLERTLLSVAGPAGDAVAFARAREQGAPAVIVVDNNSSDATPDVVASFGPAVRYIKEGRQGLSFARNTGIEAARALDAELVAFVDDDVEATPNWAAALVRAFDEQPSAECIGGRVLPSNADELPRWVTPEHWGPLALQDHGPEPLVFDAACRRGLIGANLAFRRRTFDSLGEFSPDVQRVKDGIGSTEDHEMVQRLYDAGGRAAYVPNVVVTTQVRPERMTYDYHRRWHLGHGRFTARMRGPETEQTTRGCVLGVPAHVFRDALSNGVRWVKLSAARDRAQAFQAETRLWFFSGFFKERCGCALRR